jgi:GNAT superfamily N-acetyltransferase
MPDAADAAFLVADPVKHRNTLLTLNIEYVGWVFHEIERTYRVSALEIVGMSLSEYVSLNLPRICAEHPPKGVFYLIQVNGDIAAMGGLRSLHPGVAEIKRLYVRPAYRGNGLGEQALRRLLADARRFGYERVCLDTGPFMDAAHRLYEVHGFTDCAAYEGVEVPAAFHDRWRFMEHSFPDTFLFLTNSRLGVMMGACRRTRKHSRKSCGWRGCESHRLVWRF